jgi:L-alanine-DL-glutamate epimerase-like enolase superfamily enzyme
VGPDVALLVDANGCYTPGTAIEVGRMLESHGVRHFEEPCMYWELEWTAEVAAGLDLDVAGGEQDSLLPTWRRMIGLRAVDIVQPDVCYVGGVTRTLRVAEMADEAGLRCVLHSANLSLVAVFALHVMAAIPNAGSYVEYSIEPDEFSPWQVGLSHPELEVREGHVDIPDSPGWGIEIDPSFLARADHRSSTFSSS